MTLPDYPARAPSFVELTEIGALDMRVWAIEFTPKVDPHKGPTGKEKPSKWKACIVPADPGRPMVFAIRKTAKEADEDVRRGFWQHHSNRPHKYPPPETPVDFPPSKPAPRKLVPVVEEDDFSDVI